MSNEMGNNNTTSALNEEDNASEAEKKALNEEVTAEKIEENQKISVDKGSDDEVKADDGLASNDRSEPENETSKGDTVGDSEKGENQTMPISEAGCQMEEAATAPGDAIVEPGKVSLEEDSFADDLKAQNQISPTADTENVEEMAIGLTTFESTIMLENDSSKGNTHGDVVIVENQMPPAEEVEDVLKDDTLLASNDESDVLENTTQEGNAAEDDENGHQQNHPSTEVEIVQKNDIRTHLDERTCELQERTQKETHDNDEPGENATNPIPEDLNDQSNVKDSFSDSGNPITEIIQVEKSPIAGLADEGGENCKTQSNFSLKSTEEYDKQIELCKDQLVTYDDHLEKDSSIKQEEENCVVLTSHDVELQESLQTHSSSVEFDEVLEEPSLQPSESLQRSDLPDADAFPLMDDGIVSDKEQETKENVNCGVSTEGGDGDELRSSERCASEIIENFSSINEKSNRSLLAEVNDITEHSVDSPPESDMVDKLLECENEKMSKEIQEELKLEVSGSEKENAQDFEADIINKRSNGNCDEEVNIVLGPIQVEEPKVTENVHQFDVCINKNTSLDEINCVPLQQDFMVPEAEGDGLIPGSTFVNCRLEHEENYEKKVLEEIKPEASHAALKDLDEDDMLAHCNSHLLNSGQKESHALQNSISMLHISSHQKDNVIQKKSFTSTSLKASDHPEVNLDSSNLTMATLEMVHDEAFEEGKDNFERSEIITNSEANLSSVPLLNNPVFANGSYEVMESMTSRYSTESNPENPNISCLMQKSPSFNLNLRIDATKEESDHIPLLNPGKTATDGLSNQISLNLNKPCADYDQRILQHEEMPVEEKIVTMERSYSEKFHAPFLGLLKEEEEAHLLVMPKKQENQSDTVKEVKEMEYALPKGKEKRKPRPSFFSSCMCCMTLTN